MPHLDPNGFQRRLDHALKTIADPAERALVEGYLAEKRANGIKLGTLANDALALRDLSNHLTARGKTLKAAAKEDLVGFFNVRERVRIWRAVKKDGTESVVERKVQVGEGRITRLKQTIRLFYKDQNGGDEYPPSVRGIRVPKADRDQIPTDELLTPEDIRQLLQKNPEARDKALLSVLYESGLRAGELCALNIGSVQFDDYGAVLMLPKKGAGLKTGARRVRLYNVESVPYLHAWFEHHPHKADPKAPLFYSMSRRAPGARMTPNALWQFVQRASKKAGLRKELHPHLFRHTAATERARAGWREAEMRAFFGWTRSSDMPATYVHLAGQDYEEMDLERRGLKAKGEPTARSGLAPRVCRVCKAENLSTALFCGNCRSPVSPKAEGELAQRRNEELAQIIREEVQKLLAGAIRA